MATNKILYGTTVLIDLTSDTATADDVLSGKTFHLRSGAVTTGTLTDGDSLGYGEDRSAPIVGIGQAGYMMLGNQDSSLVGTGQVGSMMI